MMSSLAWPFVLSGIAMTGWGVWAHFSRRGAAGWIGAVVAPIGVILAATGAVLVFVPRFFG